MRVDDTYDKKAARSWRPALWRATRHGGTRIGILCPFCSAEFEVYVWSFGGSGKKCPNCGAYHSPFGSAWPEKKG